jgi:hypothetical protein
MGRGRHVLSTFPLCNLSFFSLRFSFHLFLFSSDRYTKGTMADETAAKRAVRNGATDWD